MIKCPFCGTNCVANTVFCGECGHYLLKDEDRGTDPLDDEEEAEDQADQEEEETRASEAQKANEPRAIRLKIGDRERKIEMTLDKVIHMGRVDPGSDVFPEIDLTEHGPAKNISRRHASIRVQADAVVIEDLGSINGTLINGKRLEPYIPEILCDGDSLVLGKLQIEVKILTE